MSESLGEALLKEQARAVKTIKTLQLRVKDKHASVLGRMARRSIAKDVALAVAIAVGLAWVLVQWAVQS